MISKGYAACSLFVVLLTAAAGWMAMMHTPPGALVAIHFGVDGHANGFAHPAMAFMLLPGVAAGIWVLLAVAPLLDPQGANLARSQTAYGVIWLSVTLLLAAIQGAIIGVAAGRNIPMPQLTALLMAGVFVVAGNFMGKIRPNNFVGIRTPWTRASDRVWDQTHRVGGFMFVAAGLAMAAAPFLIHDPRDLMLAVAGLPAAAVLVPVCWSYVLWRRFARAGTPA
jgi:uncharacterized membrane protein